MNGYEEDLSFSLSDIVKKIYRYIYEYTKWYKNVHKIVSAGTIVTFIYFLILITINTIWTIQS